MADTKKTTTNGGKEEDTKTPINMATAFGLLAATVALYVKFYSHLNVKLPKNLNSEQERFFYTFKLLIFPALAYIFAIFNVMRGRISTPGARNPLAGQEHHFLAQTKILQNTVEQTIFFVLNILIFSLQVPNAHFYLIPLIVGLFTFGRFAFMFGYNIHPKHRVLGFTFSFAPSHLLIWYNLGRFVGVF